MMPRTNGEESIPIIAADGPLRVPPLNRSVDMTDRVGTTCGKDRLFFRTTGMTKESLNGDSIFVIRDFATSSECDSFIAESESSGYEEATITTATGSVINKHVRNNARLIHDNPELADRLWQRAKPFLPARMDAWRATGFNERFGTTAMIRVNNSRRTVMDAFVGRMAKKAN